MELDAFLKEHVDQVNKLIDASDVFVIGFTRLSQRLLIDTRYNDKEPPLIQIAQAVASPEERMEDLQRKRPAFPRPEKFTFIPWPRSLKSFQELGIWDHIRERVPALPSTVHEFDVALGMLKQIEHLEINEAISGPNRYRSLWQRKPAGSS